MIWPGTLGNVTIASGGTLAPGNSIGTFNVANITLDAGSTYTAELHGLELSPERLTKNFIGRVGKRAAHSF